MFNHGQIYIVKYFHVTNFPYGDTEFDKDIKGSHDDKIRAASDMTMLRCFHWEQLRATESVDSVQVTYRLNNSATFGHIAFVIYIAKPVSWRIAKMFPRKL